MEVDGEPEVLGAAVAVGLLLVSWIFALRPSAQALELREVVALRTRAWVIKEMPGASWDYVRRGWAERRWKRWTSASVDSRTQEMHAG